MGMVHGKEQELGSKTVLKLLNFASAAPGINTCQFLPHLRGIKNICINKGK